MPEDVAPDASGNVYVADTGNHRIQKFDASGTFLTMWGSFGTDNGQFDRPSGVATDGSGSVYVAASGNDRIQKFDASGTFLTTWGSSGSGDGQFLEPRGVATDGSGNVYVADFGHARIQKFDASGTFLTTWGSFGTGNGQFRLPSGVATDGSGSVYVADTVNNELTPGAVNHRIQKFDASGAFLTTWGSLGTGNGQFNGPSDVATDGSGSVYVADTNNHRIQKFDASGTFLTTWGSSGIDNGQFSSPIGVATDGSGNVYVADTGNQRIQKFDASGTFLTRWGSRGPDNGQFSFPSGVATDGSGNVYVADTGNHRIQKFACSTISTTTTTTTIFGTTTTTISLDFTTGTPGGICGHTLDGSNVLIRTLTCGGLNIGGGQSILPEALSPDGATSRFALNCTGSSCAIGPTSIAPPLNSTAPDCTDVGCNFGTPLPIPNPMFPVISLCVLNTWKAPASGTLDLTTGASSMNVALISDFYVTGNLTQPCPRCVAGTCDRGRRAGMACTTTSSTGYTRNCPTGGVGTPTSPCPGGPGGGGCPADNCPCMPGGGNCCDGSHAGPHTIDLSPLITGTASATDPGGIFCPGQSSVGCFGSPACRTITESGAAAGPITTGTPASATLASVFCIPGEGGGLLDGSLNVPGPGAVALPGTFLVHN